MHREYFECDCFSDEHRLAVTVDKEDGIVSITFFLQPDNFWKRLLKGIKYIFGYKCKYGHFDEFIMQRGDYDKFLETIESAKEQFDKSCK